MFDSEDVHWLADMSEYMGEFYSESFDWAPPDM
jgi:hypothetical protein